MKSSKRGRSPLGRKSPPTRKRKSPARKTGRERSISRARTRKSPKVRKLKNKRTSKATAAKRATFRRRLTRGLLVLLLSAAAISAGVWLFRLDRQIVTRFEGRRWRLPSKIYSDAFSFYTGGPFHGAHILSRLRRLGYQPARGKGLRKGEYRRGKGFLDLYLHDFPYPTAFFEGFPLKIETADGKIRRILDLRQAPPREIFSAELEPELITGLFEHVWEERSLVKLDEVPRDLVNAIIAVEDHRFYRHCGLDFSAIARALVADIRAGRIVQGASTLTQQLVKNFFLTPKRTFSRKIQEAVMALLLELRYSKDQILEAYLNEIYFGQSGSQGIYGVGEAARFYFGKPVKDLRLEEAAVLAGLIRSPALYSPHKDPERIRQRRDFVLKSMWGLGMITEERYREAVHAPLEVRGFHPQRNEAPYFVDYLVKELEKEYSLDILTSEGLRIFTTLDVEMQEQARRCVRRGLARLEKAHPGLRAASGDPAADALQACLVALEPQTGYIRAMVGGRDYKKSQFNRVVQARRQPGSLFKPIVYVTALEGKGGRPAFTPASLLRDEPIKIRFRGKTWSPRNFNDEYFGEVTLRTALEHSLNCATVRLSQKVGLSRIIETARALGITSPLEPVPSLVLGAFETVPLELAGVFAAFANHGAWSKPRAIKKVVDKEGNLLERRPMELKQAVSPQAAFLITYLLEGVMERGTGRSVAGRLTVPAAGKTGTTNDSRDAWFAGYTPRLAALVWVGFDRPRSLGLSGARAALPIWADFIQGTSDWLVTEPFVPPPGIVFRKIDRLTGRLATPACTDTITEAFLEGTEPTEPCPLHPAGKGKEGPARKGKRGVFRKILDWFR